MTEHRLTLRINEAERQGRPALIPFLTAGFPDLDGFWKSMDELDADGADVIEVGVPFSDPVADGPVVEAASQKALGKGVNLAWTLRGLGERKNRYRAALVLMGYYNPFLQYGLERFANEAAQAGVAGCIVPDLPLEEDGELRSALEERGLALVPLVGVNTGRERMRAYARKAQGYAYLVSVLGTTGVRGAFPPELKQAFSLAREEFSVPVALGFGISHPAQVEALPVRPQAIVFGSALLGHLEGGHSAAGFMERWRGWRLPCGDCRRASDLP
jgi:tryptophan synthase alpha chain